MERTPILYDEDCGFCRVLLAAALVWDRRRSLRPVPIQGPEGTALLAGLDSEQRMASWHLAPPGASPVSAGAAFGPVFRRLPGGEPLARLSERFPGASQRGYEWVAAQPLRAVQAGAGGRQAARRRRGARPVWR